MSSKVTAGVAVAEPVSEELIAFFADREGVVQVFDFDNDAVFDFNWRLYENCLQLNACFPPLACIPPLFISVWCCCMPLYLGGCARKNVRDGADAQHVCVTQDGIVYTVDKRKTACRCECTEKGKTSKTVPWDKITNCDIEEPAGAAGPVCCLVNRTLTNVTIDTASGSRGDSPLGRNDDNDWGPIGCGGRITPMGSWGGGGEGGSGHELVIVGLREPKAFKDLVWQMKRGGGGAAVAAAGPLVTSQPGLETVGGGSGGRDSELVGLLSEHNALAKQHLAKQDEILVELRKIAAK